MFELSLTRKRFPHLQMLLSIGGWTYSSYISDAVQTSRRREALAKSIVKWTLDFDMDGIDIDWEFPVLGGADGGHKSPDDCVNLVLFLETMYAQFQALATNKHYTYDLFRLMCF